MENKKVTMFGHEKLVEAFNVAKDDFLNAIKEGRTIVRPPHHIDLVVYDIKNTEEPLKLMEMFKHANMFNLAMMGCEFGAPSPGPAKILKMLEAVGFVGSDEKLRLDMEPITATEASMIVSLSLDQLCKVKKAEETKEWKAEIFYSAVTPIPDTRVLEMRMVFTDDPQEQASVLKHPIRYPATGIILFEINPNAEIPTAQQLVERNLTTVDHFLINGGLYSVEAGYKRLIEIAKHNIDMLKHYKVISDIAGCDNPLTPLDRKKVLEFLNTDYTYAQEWIRNGAWDRADKIDDTILKRFRTPHYFDKITTHFTGRLMISDIPVAEPTQPQPEVEPKPFVSSVGPDGIFSWEEHGDYIHVYKDSDRENYIRYLASHPNRELLKDVVIDLHNSVYIVGQITVSLPNRLKIKPGSDITLHNCTVDTINGPITFSGLCGFYDVLITAGKYKNAVISSNQK